jgi:hypothetical protein
MPTFVGNNPETSSWKTRHETVQRPKTEPCQSVQRRMRQTDVFRGDIRVCSPEANDEGRNDDKVHHDVQ